MPKKRQALKWDTFDVMKALFAFLPKKKSIPSAIPTLHNIVYNLSKEKGYKMFLSDYIFDLQNYFPFSRELQTDLINLEQAGLLSSPNPSFIDYTIKEKLRNTFNSYTKNRFTDDDLDTLKKMSMSFNKSISSKKLLVCKGTQV